MNKKHIIDCPVLVVGGAGYIGSHIVLKLCEEGIPVVVFDNLSTGCENNIDNRALFIKGDILNQEDIENCFNNKYRAVFHLASLKSAGESMDSPNKYSNTNIIGSLNILNQMIESDTPSFIFSSTAAVYGEPQYLPIDEDHPENPINFYGYTKLVVEDFSKWYSKTNGIQFASLRYFNAIGYDMKGRIRGVEKKTENLIPLIMEVACGMRKNIQVYGDDFDTPDGTGIRDYIHVTDLAIAHFKTLEYLEKNKKNLIINLSSGKGYSVLEIIKLVEKITSNKIPYRVVKKRKGDSSKLVAQSKFASNLLNWKCQYSDIENSLQSMWNLYK